MARHDFIEWSAAQPLNTDEVEACTIKSKRPCQQSPRDCKMWSKDVKEYYAVKQPNAIPHISTFHMIRLL